MDEFKAGNFDERISIIEAPEIVAGSNPFEQCDPEYKNHVSSFLENIEEYASPLTLESLKYLLNILRDPKVVRYALRRISRQFAKRLLVLFANASCTPALWKILVEILANFAFEFPGFSTVWCEILDENGFQHATSTLMTHISAIRNDTTKLQELKHSLLIIFNMTANDAHIFSFENIVKYGNWMLCSMRNDATFNMFTFYAINIFRFCDLDNEEVFQVLIETMTKLVLQKNMKDEPCLNICWCLYFWIRRFPNLVMPVLNPPIGPWLLMNIYQRNETISSISASIFATASYCRNYNVAEALQQNVPLSDIVNVLNRHDGTLLYIVIFLYNYGLFGSEFVATLITENVVMSAADAFLEANTQARIEIMRLLIMMIQKSPEDMLDYVMVTETVQIINEILLLGEVPIVRGTLEAVLAIGSYNMPILIEYLDLENVTAYLDTEYGELAQRILHMFEKQ